MWKEIELGNVANVLSGFAFKANEFSDRGTPVLKIKNVAAGYLRMNDVQYYPFEISERGKKFIIKGGDILIAMTGSHAHQPSSMVGKSCRYNLESISLLNQRVGKIYSRDKSKLDEDFLFYFLKQDYIPFELATSAGGSANQANISPDQIKQLSISLPPLPEQKLISETLSSLDDKIDLLHRQNKTLEALAETLFRQWFVEEETESKILGELASVSTGKGLKRNEFLEDGEFSILGANGEIGRTNKFLTDEKLILTGRVGTLGEIKISEGKVWISDNVLIIKPVKEKYFYPIYFSLKQIDFENLNVGSTQPLVTQTDLKTIQISFSKEEVLIDYANQCNELFKKIKSNAKQIKTLTQLRDTLLPKLMSGEVRINN